MAGGGGRREHFTFGGAPFHGSNGGLGLFDPMVGIQPVAHGSAIIG
jgi:hypothetical protein